MIVRRSSSSGRRSPRSSGRTSPTRSAPSCSRGSCAAAGGATDDAARRDGDRRRARRGAGDRAPRPNLLELDYPAERLEVVVTSDASTDANGGAGRGGRRARDPEPARRQGGRAGPRGARDRVRGRRLLGRERDLGARRAAAARRARSPTRASPTSAGGSRLEAAEGVEQGGPLLALRDGACATAESPLGSVTGGNGSIYAVRRSDYVEVDPRFGHDLSLPYLMVQHGRRAVYEPAALAFEKPTPTNETEYRRKVRMFEHCWLIVLRGKMLRGQPPGYLLALLSHRHLRYASGLLHLVLLATSLALVTQGWFYDVVLAAQVAARRRGGRRRRDRALLRARDLGDRRRALELPAARRARDVAAGRGHALNRALDVLDRRHRPRGHEPAARGRGARREARGRRPGALPPDARRQGRRDFELLKLRTMVVGAETIGAGLRGQPAATRGSRAPGAAAAALDRRAAAALERHPRRHVDDRAAADAPLPGRPLRRAPAPPPRREARDHRLGADPRPRRAALGRPDRARPLVRRAPLARAST